MCGVLLRAWKALDEWIDRGAGGPGQCRRLLVGRQRLPQDYLNAALSVFRDGNDSDHQTALRLKKKLAEDFREQLTVGVPTNEDEARLRRLAAQIRAKKVVVKLFLRQHEQITNSEYRRLNRVDVMVAKDMMKITYDSQRGRGAAHSVQPYVH